MSQCWAVLACSRSQEYKEVLNERDKSGPSWLFEEEWRCWVKPFLPLTEAGKAGSADQGHCFTSADGFLPASFFQLGAELTVVLSASPCVLLFKGNSTVAIFSFYYYSVDYGVFEICFVYM